MVIDPQFAFINNDNLLTLSGLRSVAANSMEYTNTASVTVTLVLSGQSAGIGGQVWPAGMTIVSSENGSWQTTLVDSLALTEGEYYQALLVANAGEGFKGAWKVPVKAVERQTN